MYSRQLVNDVIKDGIDPVPNLRRAMSDLEEPSKVDSNLLKISKVPGDNPEDYKSQTCQAATIGKALGARKGDLIEYFDSDVRQTGKSWSINPADADITKCKQTVMEQRQTNYWKLQDILLRTWQRNLVSRIYRRPKSRSQSLMMITTMQNLLEV